MTLGHFIYIPGMILLGALLGYLLASRTAEIARREGKERDARRAAREARHEARKAREAVQGGDGSSRDGAGES